MSAASADVVVIGGGFAGLRAARDLRERGRDVLVLEARERLGGRTWSVPFAGHERRVELGGAWISPRHHRHVAAEVARYGLHVTPGPSAPGAFQWRLDGVRSRAFPLAGDELYELERALYRLIAASRRIDASAPRDAQDLADLDVSLESFLQGMNLGRRTRELLAAFGALGAGSAASDWSALSGLSLIAAFDHSAYAWYAAVSDTFAGGTRSVIDALLEDARPRIRLSTAAVRVRQGPDRVTIATADGASVEGGAAVVAVPVNVWGEIEFEPPLSAAKRELAHAGHPNRMAKLWALVEGADDVVALGPGCELLYLAPQYELDGGSLMVGFSSPPPLVDVADAAAVERAVREHHPSAAVVAVEAHDWNSDPWSRGGWMTYRPGQASRLMAALQRPEGRLAFAGADVATAWIGWLDGALETGARAALDALDVLTDGPGGRV